MIFKGTVPPDFPPLVLSSTEHFGTLEQQIYISILDFGYVFKSTEKLSVSSVPRTLGWSDLALFAFSESKILRINFCVTQNGKD